MVVQPMADLNRRFEWAGTIALTSSPVAKGLPFSGTIPAVVTKNAAITRFSVPFDRGTASTSFCAVERSIRVAPPKNPINRPDQQSQNCQ